MRAVTGVGANKAGTPTRTDLPLHDMTGGNYWMPDVILYQNAQNTLRLGGGLTTVQIDAIKPARTARSSSWTWPRRSASVATRSR
jgi:hypothetical protein